MKPRLLDLFCGAGGCTKGYQEAGFYVVGVDKKPQPRYCGDEFHQADVTNVAYHLRDGWIIDDDFRIYLGEFDAVHASPPCQRFSSVTATSGNPEDHPELVAPTRRRLIESGRPYVIENVERAPLINPVTMCGAAYCPSIVENGERFRLKRHRLFEASFPVMVSPCMCSSGAGTVLGLYGGGTRLDRSPDANPGGGNTAKANAAQGRALMGIDWMTRDEMCQAIPPSYTRHIGEYLLASLDTAEMPERAA